MTIFSAWQYLHTEDEPAAGPLDLANGEPDLQGIGLFGRLAFADDDTNPWKFNASVGAGGRGVIPSRDDDFFGLGYFYSDVAPDRFIFGDVLDKYGARSRGLLQRGDHARDASDLQHPVRGGGSHGAGERLLIADAPRVRASRGTRTLLCEGGSGPWSHK